MLNEKQKTLRGDWLRVNKNSIVHYSTHLLTLIRITFGIPLSPHSFDSLDIGLSEENPIGRVSGSQTLSSLRDADCIMCIMTLHIIYLRLYSVRGRFFLHVCITWEYIHLAHSTRPYLLSSGQKTKREFHLQRVFDSSNC